MMRLHAQGRNIGFTAATLSMLMAFAASVTPIPLYDIYRHTNGITLSELSLTAVVYFVGAVTALLVFGRISDHLGRKPVTLLAFGLSGVACLLLLRVDGAAPLIAGRLLLGLSCGLASSAIASFVVDSAPAPLQWLAPVVVANSPMAGLTIGALVSGTLVQYGAYPRTLCYVAALAGLLLCAVLVCLSRETVRPKPGLAASLRPRFSLPQADKRLYPIAACTFVATWALGGFYQAYGPSIATEQLGSATPLAAAAVFSSYLLPSAIGGPLTARLTPAQAQRRGMVVFTLAVGATLVCLKLSLIGPCLLASGLAGAAQGAVVTGSIRSLLAGANQTERAGVLSLIYATSYTGAAVPSLVAGQLSRFMSLLDIALGYGALALLSCIIILLFAREPIQDHEEPQNVQHSTKQ